MTIRLSNLKVAIPTTLLTHVLAAKVAPVAIPFTPEGFSTIKANFGLQASGNTAG